MRIPILFIVVLGLPICFFSCNPCGKGGSPGFWTFSSAEPHALSDDLKTEIFSGDTVSGDDLNYRIQLNMTFLTQNTFGYNPYAAMACEPAEPNQSNKVTKINWGLKYPGTSQLDTGIVNSLRITKGIMSWNWNTQKEQFIQELSGDFGFSNLQSYMVTAKSPHKGSNIQLIIHLLKQNGDTLVSKGPVVFCK